MRGAAAKQQHSLFSRHRASSVERELARTPYAFTPKPREDRDPSPDESIRLAKERILDPFEDDINVRLAKERLFGGYSKIGSRAASPTIFPTNDDFGKRLEQDNLENSLFGPDVSVTGGLSNFSDRFSDTSSMRTVIKNDILNTNSPIINKVPLQVFNNKQVIKSIESSPARTRSNSSATIDRSSVSSKLNDRINNNKTPKSNLSVLKPKTFRVEQDLRKIEESLGSSVKSGSFDTGDSDTKSTITQEINRNSGSGHVTNYSSSDRQHPAFRVKEVIRPNQEYFEDLNRPVSQRPPKVNKSGLERYKRSRALAEGYTDRFYRSISHEFGSVDSLQRTDGSGSDENRESIGVNQLSGSRAPDAEAFTVIGAMPSADMESVSSAPSSYKVTSAVRPHRNTAFAILGEAQPVAQPTQGAIPPISPPPPPPSGRVSPFRGKGFKGPDISSRRSSRAQSPDEIDAPLNNSQSQSHTPNRANTPARNYIQENIEEVKELSEFNKEKNQEEAEKKKFEEEMEILKELGIVENTKYTGNKINLRSRSGSPAAIIHFQNIPPPATRNFETRDGLTRKPPPGRVPLRVFSKSQPQSKTGSPQHHSKIPRRQTSVSPPRQRSGITVLEPSRMSNALSSDGRFISNSTSSINDRRVFSVIDGDSNYSSDGSAVGYRSKSQSNVATGPTSILKNKPPKSPGKLGPPPTHKAINSKRLSPIVSTPDKSPTQAGVARRGDAKGKFVAGGSTSSPSTTRGRASKSLATSPTTSRTPSRAPSRAASRGPAKDTSPINKSASSVSKTNSGNKVNGKASTSGYRTYRADSKDSTESDNRPALKRVNSRSSIMSRVSTTTTGKPELKRTNSRSSIKPLSRGNSIKSSNEKPGTAATKRKQSLKDVQEKSGEDKSPKNKGKSTKTTATRQTSEDIPTQDNETQYDKMSHLGLTMERLIPLTKGSVVSMTTAAITANPLEIAAKVTSQLPTTFEKAREKKILERMSSTDSIAIKMASEGEGKDNEDDHRSRLQKTASKTSLGSLKEEKEPAPKSDSSTIIHNNLKLKPILAPSDPQLVKIKQKIDNILNSSQSSVVDLREKVSNDDKQMSEKVKLALEKVTEKADDVDKAVEKGGKKLGVAATIAAAKAAEQVKSNITKAAAEEAKKLVRENTDSIASGASSLLNGKKSGMQKNITPVESVTTAKVEPTKTNSTENINSKAELVKVKEATIKKESLTPVVTVVNERNSGNSSVEGQERMTEAIVRGDPDVEVQSANMAAGSNMRDNGLNKIPSNNKLINNSVSAVKNLDNVTDKKMDKMQEKKNNTMHDKKMEKAESNGSTGIEDGSSHSETSSKVNGATSSNGSSKPAPAVPPPPASEPAVPPGPPVQQPPPTACGRWMNGIREKMTCCGCKPHNLSEVNLIDENTGKKRGSTLTSQSMASTLQQQAAEKPSALRKMCCFCRPNYGLDNTAGENTMGTNRENLLMEKKPWWRSACCSGGNKVRDSNATMMSGAATPAWKKPLACCCGRGYEERRRREWADRRDSILSQPMPMPWWRRVCCCGASGAAAAASRRTSLFSKKRSLSQAVPLEDKRPKLDASLVEHSSHLRGAIPALPVPLAWICFVCNLLIPGLGTVCSGLFCLCFGRPRFGVYDGYRQRIGAFVIDVIVGVGQLFTVLFCLVGWGWSIWWATIMLKVARKYRKLKKTAAEAERNGIPATTNNHRTHPA